MMFALLSALLVIIVGMGIVVYLLAVLTAELQETNRRLDTIQKRNGWIIQSRSTWGEP